ncbi:hypothetical protein DQ04_07901010 [Trypanosoma grayi]|uniref:hypothetical protein n=1 Tax=Trypanosoma grayi TaxID=71804 RepID=UPI0004F467BC|nr:hypothetical protein DQ04_07901010 [Trypanosoma grayi]KEG08144.1 hypothetical protein DQ04_07901010 [Trypanosoma grayi]
MRLKKVQRRNEKRRRFAGPRTGHGDHIVALNHWRDCLALDGRRHVVAEPQHTVEERLVEPKALKPPTPLLLLRLGRLHGRLPRA